jgi:PAS domain S-box-containing protein
MSYNSDLDGKVEFDLFNREKQVVATANTLQQNKSYDLQQIRTAFDYVVEEYKALFRHAERLNRINDTNQLARRTAEKSLTKNLVELKQKQEELEQKQEELEQKNTLFKTILANLNQGMIAYDKNLRLVAFNNQMHKIRGFPEHLAHTGSKFEDWLRYDAESGEFGSGPAEGYVQKYMALVKNDDHHSFERVRPNRTTIMVNGSPLPGGGFVSTFTDISKIKHIEHQQIALLRELNFQKYAVDQHSIVSVTDAKGKITYANDKFVSVSGLAQNEILGRTHNIIQSDHHNSGFFRELWKTISAGDVWKGELCNRASNGTIFWVTTAIVPFVNENQEVERYIAIQTDITERKLAEQKVQELNINLEHRVQLRTSELEQSNQELLVSREEAENANRAKSEFLAVISHEIRTPLNAILGIAQIIRETDLDSEQSRYMKILNKSGEGLLSIIEDILDLAQIESGRLTMEKKSVNIQKLIQSAIEIHTLDVERKGLELNYRIDTAIPEQFEGDPKRLRQVLLNMLGNAIKFTNQGKIELSVSQQNYQSLQFSISDTGIGIPQEKLEMIFKQFSQVDTSTTRQHGGVGLGLDICKRLVNAMGGQLWVESEIGSGSTFHFSVPLLAKENDPDQPSFVQDSGVDSVLGKRVQNIDSALSILLAEDVEENALVIDAYLKNTPHHLDIVTDGSQAVDKIKCGTSYDLILMDIQMPQMDGLEATQQIRAWESRLGNSKTTIFALTAHAMNGDEEKSIAAGCDMHITKPITKAKLLDLIEPLKKQRTS